MAKCQLQVLEFGAICINAAELQPTEITIYMYVVDFDEVAKRPTELPPLKRQYCTTFRTAPIQSGSMHGGTAKESHDQG